MPSTLREEAELAARNRGRLPEGALLYAKRQNPLPNVAAYATAEATGIAPVPLNRFRELLADIPLAAMLSFLCGLQAMIAGNEVNREAQLRLARRVYGDTEAFHRLRRFVDNGPGERVIFSEQGLTLLQWLAIENCSEEPATELSVSQVTQIQRCLYGATSYLDAGVGADEPEEGRRERWLAHLTRSFDYNRREELGDAMARTWAILGRLHRDAVELRPLAPFEEWFAEDFGLSLERQLTLGFAVFAHLNQGEDGDEQLGTVLERATFADICARLDLDDTGQRAAENLISAPLSWYQGEVSGMEVGRLGWTQVPFFQRPLIRLDDERFLLQSPRALHAWVVEGPYYRGLDCAHARGAAEVSVFTARIGKLTERYVVEMVRMAHVEPRLPGAGKVWGEKNYGRGAHSSDVTITYPNRAVLVEVASHRLSLEAKRDGDPAALEHDLTEMVGRRPEQLSRSIEAMKPLDRGRAVTLRFPHLEAKRIARFWPIIVTATPLHFSPLLEEFFSSSIAQLEERSDVEPLELMAIEDLEVLVALAEESGSTIPDLLTAKAEALGPHADLRRWIFETRPRRPLPRNKYLQIALTEILDLTTRTLGFEDLIDTEGAA